MIRNARPDDISEITSIYNGYVAGTTITFDTLPAREETMLERMKEITLQYPYLVYEENGEILGYCYVHAWKAKPAYSKTVETTIYLRQNCIHKGVGTQLMHQLIERCRENGFHALVACITSENEVSLKFHEKLGFVCVSEFKEVGFKFDRWLGVIDMELII